MVFRSWRFLTNLAQEGRTLFNDFKCLVREYASEIVDLAHSAIPRITHFIVDVVDDLCLVFQFWFAAPRPSARPGEPGEDSGRLHPAAAGRGCGVPQVRPGFCRRDVISTRDSVAVVVHWPSSLSPNALGL